VTWVVTSDFNLIVNILDKSNDLLNRNMMGKFRWVLGDLELKEMCLNGRRHTWSNKREHPTLEKLDLVFSVVDWEFEYPASFLTALGSSASDHSPLLLRLSVQMKVGKRFHFKAFWPKVSDSCHCAWHESQHHALRTPSKDCLLS
jgi:hypothetical protein